MVYKSNFIYKAYTYFYLEIFFESGEQYFYNIFLYDIVLPREMILLSYEFGCIHKLTRDI